MLRFSSISDRPLSRLLMFILATVAAWNICRYWQTVQYTEGALEKRAFQAAGLLLKRDPDTIILGSSHLWTGVSSAEFSRLAVNVSHGSNDYTMIEHSLTHALSQSDSIEFAIIELGVVPLYGNSVMRSRGLGFAAMGMNRMKWPRPLFLRVRRQIRDHLFGPFLDQPRLTPAGVIAFLEQPPIPEYPPGFKPLPAERFRDNSKIRASSHASRRRSGGHFSKNRGAVDQILDLLEHHSVKSLWVIPPATKEYLQAMPNFCHEDLEELSGYLANRPLVYIVDLNSWGAEHLSRSDFFDADHLNVNGAIKASKHLDQLINQLREQQAVSPK